MPQAGVTFEVGSGHTFFLLRRLLCLQICIGACETLWKDAWQRWAASFAEARSNVSGRRASVLNLYTACCLGTRTDSSSPCLPAKTGVPEPVMLEFWMKRKFLGILLRLTCTSQSERAAAAGVSWLRSAVTTLEAVLKLARDQAMRCWQASWALRIS